MHKLFFNSSLKKNILIFSGLSAIFIIGPYDIKKVEAYEYVPQNILIATTAPVNPLNPAETVLPIMGNDEKEEPPEHTIVPAPPHQEIVPITSIEQEEKIKTTTTVTKEKSFLKNFNDFVDKHEVIVTPAQPSPTVPPPPAASETTTGQVLSSLSGILIYGKKKMNS